MMEKVATALVSALCGAVLTYGVKAIAIEGRMDAIERSLQRIETRLLGPVK
ncbi:MAG: hypothetical protein J0H69_00660 [Burkholderiales bacterium]|nr:hypothetical protein [Burkholderiales bacterium]